MSCPVAQAVSAEQAVFFIGPGEYVTSYPIDGDKGRLPHVFRKAICWGSLSVTTESGQSLFVRYWPKAQSIQVSPRQDNIHIFLKGDLFGISWPTPSRIQKIPCDSIHRRGRIFWLLMVCICQLKIFQYQIGRKSLFRFTPQSQKEVGTNPFGHIVTARTCALHRPPINP